MNCNWVCLNHGNEFGTAFHWWLCDVSQVISKFCCWNQNNKTVQRWDNIAAIHGDLSVVLIKMPTSKASYPYDK